MTKGTPRSSKKSIVGKQSARCRVSTRDDRADGTANQVVPYEPETVLARGPEQVQDEIGIQGTPTEVHCHGGRALIGSGLHVVDVTARFGHPRSGGQRPDFRNRTDKSCLTDAETTAATIFAEIAPLRTSAGRSSVSSLRLCSTSGLLCRSDRQGRPRQRYRFTTCAIHLGLAPTGSNVVCRTRCRFGAR